MALAAVKNTTAEPVKTDKNNSEKEANAPEMPAAERTLSVVAREIDQRKKVRSKAQEQIDKLDVKIKELDDKKVEFVREIDKINVELKPLVDELTELMK